MANDRDLDDILASIRRIVVEEPLVRDPGEPAAAAAPEVTAPVAEAAVPPAAAPPGNTSLEALVLPLLEPMLKAWLDANLPEIVDAAARAEIARLTGAKP